MSRVTFFLCILIFTFNSCHTENDNEYFCLIDKEFTSAEYNQKMIKLLCSRELGKYKQTGNKKYLLGSKYGEFFLYDKDDPKQMSLLYELIKINNGEYGYINVACNYYLAIHVETSSPYLSFQFINEAIKTDEKITERDLFLPHLYHFKGKLFHNQKKFTEAMHYYKKALKSFKKEDILFIASMYNNFGLIFRDKKEYNLAISQMLHAIKILEQKPNLNKEELFTLYGIKGNLGGVYYLNKDYMNAEKYLISEITFLVNNNRYSQIVQDLRPLLFCYRFTNQNEKLKQYIDLLVKILPQITKGKDKITAVELLQSYYRRTDDLENLKKISKLSPGFYREYNAEIIQKANKASDLLNSYIIKNINQQYTVEIEKERRKNTMSIIVFTAVALVSANVFIKIRKKNKQEKDHLENEKILLADDKKRLEKTVKMHRGKIKNLHLNLNLKRETEMVFLESIKKIRRSRSIVSDEMIKDLYFKANNLLKIDEKNNELINECSVENDLFMEKLASKFPDLKKRELKLCVYYRLNLSSKEISLLENITPGSVRVYKAKVKAKIGLDKDEDLEVYLNMIK